MGINWNEFVYETTATSLLKHFDQFGVIFDNAQNVAIQEDRKNIFVAQLFSG